MEFDFEIPVFEPQKEKSCCNTLQMSSNYKFSYLLHKYLLKYFKKPWFLYFCFVFAKVSSKFSKRFFIFAKSHLRNVFKTFQFLKQTLKNIKILILQQVFNVFVWKILMQHFFVVVDVACKTLYKLSVFSCKIAPNRFPPPDVKVQQGCPNMT